MAGKQYKKASDIKVGVIGYGGAFNMGRGHLNQMKDAGMTPAAVCDLDAERVKAAEDDFPGIQTYTSVEKMLKESDVDLVTVITPHNTHADIAVQCLKAGRHVVTEKPFAITVAECDKMIRTAKKKDLMLSTYHNRHWDGWILEAVKRIKSGVIGDVIRIECHMGGYGKPRDWWRSSKSISGGILYDWGVHLLEYALQIMDSDIVEVTGYSRSGFWADKTAWKDDTIEDEGFAVARFSNNGWVTLTITSIDAKPKSDRGALEITGTKGTYIMHFNEYEIITPKANGETVSRRGANPKGEQHRYYQNIADHLVKGVELIITPEWARRPIQILDLACKSAVAGRAMKAKYK